MYRYRNCTKAFVVKGYEVESKPCNTQSCAMGKHLVSRNFLRELHLSRDFCP